MQAIGDSRKRALVPQRIAPPRRAAVEKAEISLELFREAFRIEPR